MADRVYWLWLATRKGVGARAAADLLEHFGGPEEIYCAERGALLLASDLNAAQVDALCDKGLDSVNRILEDCTRQNIHVLTLGDSGYPDRLSNIYDPPLILYWKGRQPAWDMQPMVSIVGTRRSTSYGQLMAEKFGRSLTESGFLVVSGMADGVDGAANRGALRAGASLAVLGCGVDICYPISNSHLYGDLILAGTLLSEYPPGTRPEGWRFPQRNRIISGLSVATIVIEAPERSGALITARLALEQGRDVYAVPGRLDEPRSAGCNALIREGHAALLTDPLQIVRAHSSLLREFPDERRVSQVFREMTGFSPKAADPPKPRADRDPWSLISQQGTQRKRRRKPEKTEEPSKPAPTEQVTVKRASPAQASPAKADASRNALPAGLNSTERRIIEAVQAGAQTTDQLVLETGLPAAQLLSAITMMELNALLTNDNGTITLTL